MAKNYVQPGDVLTIPAPANTLSGEVVIVGDIRGIAENNAAESGVLDVRTRGVFDLPKAAVAIGLGAKVYYVASSKLVTTTASGNTLIGVAVTAASVSDSSVRVILSF